MTLRVKKSQIIQASGELVNNAYAVQSGLLRSYVIDAKGKEHIFMFAPEGWIVGDFSPANSPCQLFIDALEDSEILVLDKSTIEEDQEITEKLVRRLYVLQQRVIMLMNASAIERYEHFVDTYPDIVQRVPQRMIASYLGITPEALSKVKHQCRK